MGRKVVKGGNYKPAVAIDRAAKDGVGDWAAKNDMEIGRCISKILLWFLKADDLVQTVVMSRPVPRIRNAYAAALRELADEMEGKPRTGSGPTFDVTLLDEKGDPVDEEPEKSHAAATRTGQGKKP